MSNSNSGNSSSDSDDSVASSNNKKPTINIKGNWFKKIEIDDKVKDEKIIINKGFSKTPFEKKLGYGHGQSGSIFIVSLPCPVKSCRFGGFSQTYDKYLPELKHCLLTSNNKHDDADEMKFSWVDWSYNVNRNACWRATKRVMKLSMATYSARMKHIDEFPSLQKNSPFKRYHKMNLYHIDKLPLSW